MENLDYITNKGIKEDSIFEKEVIRQVPNFEDLEQTDKYNYTHEGEWESTGNRSSISIGHPTLTERVAPIVAGILLALVITSLYFKPYTTYIKYKEIKIENSKYQIETYIHEVDKEALGKRVK